jgi:hypothetical protein
MSTIKDFNLVSFVGCVCLTGRWVFFVLQGLVQFYTVHVFA